MKGQERKAAVAAYKERVATPGIFAVRCAPMGGAWIGQSRNIDAQKTGLWFALNAGSYPNREIQAAWKAHGEAAFSFEPLERLEPESVAYVLTARLKERLTHWRATLNAARL
mgnify:CR=1 FL=1